MTAKKLERKVPIVYSEEDWYNTLREARHSTLDVIRSLPQTSSYDPAGFNTPLIDPDNRYPEWAKRNIPAGDTGKDYDYQGAFMAGYDRGNDGSGHLPDTFKKPNHPTFSNVSVYAFGPFSQFAGYWEKYGGEDRFVPSPIMEQGIINEQQFWN